MKRKSPVSQSFFRPVFDRFPAFAFHVAIAAASAISRAVPEKSQQAFQFLGSFFNQIKEADVVLKLVLLNSGGPLTDSLASIFEAMDFSKKPKRTAVLELLRFVSALVKKCTAILPIDEVRALLQAERMTAVFNDALQAKKFGNTELAPILCRRVIEDLSGSSPMKTD